MNKLMKKEPVPGRDHIGVGGGALIFNHDKEILLMRRSGNVRNNAGWWSKPGGGIEYGETASKMVKREVKEETGIDIDIWGQLPHTDHIIKKEGQHWVAINFIADHRRGMLKNREPHKCDELKWFPLDRLPKKIEQTTREAIKNYSAGKYIKLK